MPGLKAFLKNVVRGTPLEPSARAVWKAIRKKTRDDVYNDLTLAILRRILRRDSNCIDVGCFEGVVLDEILRLAPQGTHYAFEPLPHLCAALRKKYAGRSNVVVCELALSNAAGQAPFQYNVDHPGYSGFRRREYPSPNDRVEVIPVRTERLDAVLPRDYCVAFLKVDVEGAEHLVFEGAAEVLRRDEPVVVFEHGLGSSEFYESGPEKVFGLLADCGLKISLLEDYLRQGEPLSQERFAQHYEARTEYYFVAHP
jgi:FkbM family methyltransferase